MEREGIVYGYARVSAKDQKLRRQIDALTDFPVAEGCIYADKASGKDFERPEYRKLVKRLRPGDVMVVKSIDRLGRNYDEILEQWRILTKVKRAFVVVLDMRFSTRATTSTALPACSWPTWCCSCSAMLRNLSARTSGSARRRGSRRLGRVA